MGRMFRALVVLGVRGTVEYGPGALGHGLCREEGPFLARRDHVGFCGGRGRFGLGFGGLDALLGFPLGSLDLRRLPGEGENGSDGVGTGGNLRECG